MAVEKKVKAPKLANPEAASIDPATQMMIQRSHDLGVETDFDRAVTMKPCAIGLQGTCCKNCAMGPCRLPLPKGGIEGEDTRKGLCGATPNTIAARNFARMVASGSAAHSDHGRSVAEVFLSVARKETEDYRIKDPGKLLAIAHTLDVDTTVEVDGEQLPASVKDTMRHEAAVVTEVMSTLDPLMTVPREIEAHEFEQLIAFLHALSSPSAVDLAYLIPESVPSGLPIWD